MEEMKLPMTVSGLIYLYKIQEYAWGQGTERRGTVGAGSMLANTQR